MVSSHLPQSSWSDRLPQSAGLRMIHRVPGKVGTIEPSRKPSSPRQARGGDRLRQPGDEISVGPKLVGGLRIHPRLQEVEQIVTVNLPARLCRERRVLRACPRVPPNRSRSS